MNLLLVEDDLTTRGQLSERIRGLDAGADDYLVKPFPFDELLARVRAVMRRAQGRVVPAMSYGDVTLDPAKRHAPLRALYDLDEIVVHIASEFDVAAQKDGRTIQLVTEPCGIQCDVDEIGILLRNLVDNALRYTTAGGQIRIACGHRTTASERRIFLEVSDDGPGVPEEEQTAIFDRFHRVPGSGTRGSGIGLSWSPRLLDYMMQR